MTFNSRNGSQKIDRDLSKGFFSCRGNQPVTQPCSYDGSGGLLGESGTFMIDSWGFESSAQDPGQTHSGADAGIRTTFSGPHDGVRLDYILHNSPVDDSGDPRLCMQHIRKGYATDGPSLSDHLPLSADFNRPAPRCGMRPRMAGDPELLPGDDPNPVGPQRVFFEVLDPSSPNFKEHIYDPSDGLTGITFPGSVQWYVVDQPYPYKLATQPTGSPAVTVAYDVFQARDMSTPVPAYQGECVVEDRGRECLYLLSDPPYYIKVFAATDANPRKPDRDSTGGYTISFKRYDCSSIEEACPLETGILNGPYAWPANQQLDPNASSDTMWFRFETVYPRSGPEGPVLSVLHEYPEQKEDPGGPIDFFKVVYHRKDGQALIAQHEFSPEPPLWADEPPGSAPVTPLWRRQATVPSRALPGLTKGRGVPETYLLSVTRDSNYNDRITLTWVELKRGLTWFRPLTLNCIVERTYVGQDDIASEFSFGSFKDGKRMLGDVAGDFETWDRGSQMRAHGTPSVVRSNWPAELDAVLGAGEGVGARLWEDVLDGDDFPLSQWSAQGIQQLPPDAGPESGSIKRGLLWSNDLDAEDSDYRYRMHYQLSHRPLPPKAVGHCGPEREFDDKSTGEFWCFCLNDQACDVDQNGDPTGQICDLTRGRCVFP